MSGSPLSQKTYTYASSGWKDLLTNFNGDSIIYDEIGNPTQYRDDMDMTWSAGRQLASVTQGTNSYSFSYDASGTRISKTVNGTTYSYIYDNGQLIYADTPVGGMTFIYENDSVVGYKYGPEYYYYIKNLQGDIIGVIDKNCNLLYQYEYDAWGNHTVLDAQGNTISPDAPHVANFNPLRYRGYFFDTETGLYYLLSRYYDPETGRFVNADGYLATGQGILGTNMYSYCCNNPVNRVDATGEFFISALIIGGVALIGTLFLGGCSAEPEPKPEPYNSADEAAKAFSEEIYNSSLYIRHEYSTEIYSRTINGVTTYNYNSPRAGQPHSATVGHSVPKGTKTVAYAHTHPNSNNFSGSDISAARSLGMNAYVVGPNLNLQKYSLSSGSIINLGKISPIALTEEQKASLVRDFKVSWDAHIAAGCDFNCGSMIWPTP